MRLLLGCIADDYTGASDLASMLNRNGLRTIQTIGVPHGELALEDADAIVISLKSRSTSPDIAVSTSLAAETWLRQRGAAHILFKICSTFDSTDSGNIGPVMDALRDRAGCGPVLVTPAFPENGRSVFQGLLFVNGVPLHESAMKDHPINPMRDSNLVRLLARQSAAKVGLLPFATVEEGYEAILAAVRDADEADEGALIADAVASRHLDALATAALEQPLSVGASGLGSGLARILRARNGLTCGSDQSIPSAIRRTGPFAAFLAGSCSAATRLQISTAAAAGTPCLQLDITKLLGVDRDLAIDEAISWAIGRLAAGPILIASSDTPDRVSQVQAVHGHEVAGNLIEQAFARIAEALIGAGVGRLVIAGGETSGAIVDRLGLQAFLIGPEIAPGVPAMRTIGSNHASLAVALKSGNFGSADFFQRALSLLGA